MTAPALVLLAAGLGSRYGGLKQLDPLGPGGATLMDYAVYDGWRAGFGAVVFVIRPEMAEAFERQVGSRYRGRLPVRVAFQRAEALPPAFTVPAGRTRPWGTTQAVLAAREAVEGSFAVLNADDCYGRDAIAAAARFLAATPPDAPDHAVVGYRLDQTASPAGGVNRAVLRVSPEGLLQGITETRDLVAGPGGDFSGIGPGGHVQVAKDTPVSMNLWAFTRAIFPPLEAAFLRFLEAGPGTSGESYLPDAVQDGLDRGQARVRVLPTTSRWCGVTYAADREWVQRQLAAAVDRGDYPAALWP